MSEDTQKPSRDTLEDMVYKIFRYQQRQKYWKIAKFSFLILFIGGIGFSFLRQINPSWMRVAKNSAEKLQVAKQAHISLVDLKGTIEASFDAATASTSDTLIPALRLAFKDPKTAAVVLRINSPGGFPVESDNIYKEILYLRQKYPKIPIYAVCEEYCASGGYYIASACNAIYASPYTCIGSIGVVGGSFGYEELMKKLGVERRLFTAGENKAMLDPYSPLKKEHVQIIQEFQAHAHQGFIDAVKKGRGNRLKNLDQNEKEIFSGRIWSGSRALDLGLIDKIGNLDTIARELKVGIVDYTPQHKPQPDLFLQIRKIAHHRMSTHMLQGELSQGMLAPLFRGFINSNQL